MRGAHDSLHKQMLHLGLQQEYPMEQPDRCPAASCAPAPEDMSRLQHGTASEERAVPLPV